MAKDDKEKARTDVRRAQTRFAQTGSKHEEAREARRKSFERARDAGMTLREIAETAGLHWTRVGEILGRRKS